MIRTTNNLRISDISAVDSPEKIFNEIPISESIAALVNRVRTDIHKIIYDQDDRLLVVVGPCSIHEPQAALEYGQKLLQISQPLSAELLIIMRTYFEKPRTRTGWKGLINDPDLNGSFDINKGVRMARILLLELNEMGLAAGTEFLDIVIGQYIADLISWGAIGARTTESQVHREMASGLSCPVGFKNGTDGNTLIACDAIIACSESHIFLSPTQAGKTAVFTTTGNKDAHVILRGGSSPNYSHNHIQQVTKILQKNNLREKVMIDLSHANSQKQFKQQLVVAADICAQVAQGEQKILGVMIESHLHEGRQNIEPGKPLRYGQSITDACLSFDNTLPLLEDLATAVQQRRQTCIR